MNQKSASVIKSFIQDIQRDLADYQQLHQLLKVQHHNMLHRNGEKLTAMAESHQHLLQQLQQRADQRTWTLNQLGMDNSPDSVNRLISALPAQYRQPVDQKWTLLKSLVHTCMAQNERNSRLLMMQQDILTQVLHQDNDATYQPA
ncbi:flagellar export chaperone FlgN [Photobacterium sp. ZSDE20]|uniref:Flagellar export chaperone FlgN n=1 Tax=Photobacterium pectinilyticum TaxID=2906793 RepID=A0ABT1MY39_9GAMM|nr:flagellar export chaperone FlgN [Photobacterium sp. ZSDE20]MCQ1057421.1 flagellar export chaperone FlgN [Photobacterium sp. ZSDE20]MDD1821630.1 flagellar export chaperone FlgN [Photobacterium sp. ZSDE20]